MCDEVIVRAGNTEKPYPRQIRLLANRLVPGDATIVPHVDSLPKLSRADPSGDEAVAGDSEMAEGFAVSSAEILTFA